MNDLSIDVDLSQNPINVTVKSTLDAFNKEAAESKLLNIAQGATSNVCLDLCNVDFVDSSSVGAIVHFYKKLRCKNLELSIKGLQEQPLGLFQLLGLDKLMSCQKQ